MKRLLATLAIPLVITACGSDDEQSAAFPRTLNLGDNYQATLDMTDIDQGISDITVTIHTYDGSPLPDGEEITITPLMEMVSGMNHDTPVSIRNGEPNDEGEFQTTAYFLMPSGPEMGEWYLTVDYAGESETFNIDVDMSTSERQMLVGDTANDKIKDMNDNDISRKYFLFNEGRHVTDSMNAFTVYVAARETMMLHTSLTTGITLTGEMAMDMESMSVNTSDFSSRAMAMPASDYDLIVNTVTVEMCTSDCDTTGDWETAEAVEGKSGQYKASNLGLTGNSSDAVNVKLSVNGTAKLQGDGTAYATFTFDGDSASSTMNH